MKARTILLTLLCAVGMTAYANEKIYVNRDVTTHIVMPEPIKLVDISTPRTHQAGGHLHPKDCRQPMHGQHRPHQAVPR